MPYILSKTGDSPPDLQKQALEDGPMDKREIDWKLTLHQIGCSLS